MLRTPSNSLLSQSEDASPHSHFPCFSSFKSHIRPSPRSLDPELALLQKSASTYPSPRIIEQCRRPVVISAAYAENLAAAARSVEPALRLPELGSDQEGRQLFLAQLCVQLIRHLELAKAQARDAQRVVAEWERTLRAKEEDLEEIAMRLVEERKDFDAERDRVAEERRELDIMRRECATDRDTLLTHTKSLDRQSIDLAGHIAAQRLEAQALEAKRTRLVSRLQRTLKLQKAFKLQLHDFEIERREKELILSQLDHAITARQALLSQSHRDTPQFHPAKPSTESGKTLSIASLQTQTEEDAETAMSGRIGRLEKLGDELAQAKERLEMGRSDLESQLENLREKLRNSERESISLKYTISQLQGELSGVRATLQRTLAAKVTSEDLTIREKLLSRQEEELTAGIQAAAEEHKALSRLREDLSTREEGLKAAKEAFLALRERSEEQLQADRDKLSEDRKQLEKTQSQLTWTQVDLEHTAAEIAAQIQAAQQTFQVQETALRAEKAEVQDLMELLEREGKQIIEREIQLRALSRQLTARELQVYTREKEVRHMEHSLPHRSTVRPLDLRTPGDDHCDDLLSYSVSPSPPEPQSLDHTPV